MLIQATNEQIEITNGKHKFSIWLTPEIVNRIADVKEAVRPNLTSSEAHSINALKQSLFDRIFSTRIP